MIAALVANVSVVPHMVWGAHSRAGIRGGSNCDAVVPFILTEGMCPPHSVVSTLAV